jgi:CCR4-NOT transcriptional regulation complex NOT5 subunit
MYTFLREKLKRQFKAIEAARLSRDVERAGMMLDSAKEVLHQLQTARLTPEQSINNDEEDIEAQMQDMLEVLQDVRSTVTDLYQEDFIRSADKVSVVSAHVP